MTLGHSVHDSWTLLDREKATTKYSRERARTHGHWVIISFDEFDVQTGKKNLSMSNALKNFLHQMSLNAKQK